MRDGQRDYQTDEKTDVLLNHRTTGRSNKPSTLESRIIVSSRLLIFLFFSTQDIFNYYELCKHKTHVLSVRSHSGYVYIINICNENDYKTFLTNLCN